MNASQRALEIANREALRLVHKTIMPRLPTPAQRRWLDAVALLAPLPRDVSAEPAADAPFPTKRIAAAEAREEDGAILYLHGGGFVTGSWKTQKTIAAGLSRSSGRPAYMPEYRLAPEHPFPAALDDALATYGWLLERGVEPASIVISGDSAGGGLALAAAHAIRDETLPMPGALYLVSPWVDLTLSSPSIDRVADPTLNVAWVGGGARAYAGSADPSDPRISPLFAEQAGLPPVLIHAGSEEIFVDECRDLADRLEAAAVDVELKVYDGMWHEFQVHAPLVRRSTEALEAAGEFIRANA